MAINEKIKAYLQELIADNTTPMTLEIAMAHMKNNGINATIMSSEKISEGMSYELDAGEVGFEVRIQNGVLWQKIR